MHWSFNPRPGDDTSSAIKSLFDTVTARDVKEAVSALRTSTPALVVVDTSLLEDGACVVCRAAKQMFSKAVGNSGIQTAQQLIGVERTRRRRLHG